MATSQVYTSLRQNAAMNNVTIPFQDSQSNKIPIKNIKKKIKINKSSFIYDEHECGLRIHSKNYINIYNIRRYSQKRRAKGNIKSCFRNVWQR